MSRLISTFKYLLYFFIENKMSSWSGMWWEKELHEFDKRQNQTRIAHIKQHTSRVFYSLRHWLYKKYTCLLQLLFIGIGDRN